MQSDVNDRQAKSRAHDISMAASGLKRAGSAQEDEGTGSRPSRPHPPWRTLSGIRCRGRDAAAPAEEETENDNNMEERLCTLGWTYRADLPPDVNFMDLANVITRNSRCKRPASTLGHPSVS